MGIAKLKFGLLPRYLSEKLYQEGILFYNWSETGLDNFLESVWEKIRYIFIWKFIKKAPWLS